MKDIKLLRQNIVLIAGYLGGDPDFRSTSSGLSVCNFRVGVSRGVKDKATGEWRDDTSWIPVTVWGEAADRLRNKLKKGSPVHVEGRLKSSQFEDKKTGQTRNKLEVVANRVQGLARISEDGGGASAPIGAGAEEEEVPF